MANPVVLTNEQLQALLSGMREMFQSPPQTTSVQSAAANFSKCGSRFSGKTDEDVEAFIDAITVYKDCLNISDENAVKGLPMLLDGPAAVWWQGTKTPTILWAEVLDALRHAFGFNKPAHQIYRDLFSRQQTAKEPTDLFVNQAKALLSKLTIEPPLPEEHKLEMVYGLLHHNIR